MDMENVDESYGGSHRLQLKREPMKLLLELKSPGHRCGPREDAKATIADEWDNVKYNCLVYFGELLQICRVLDRFLHRHPTLAS